MRSAADMVLLRYKSDGTLDDGFGTNGIVVDDFAAPGDECGSGAWGTVLELQDDGKVVVSGYLWDHLGDTEYDPLELWYYVARFQGLQRPDEMILSIVEDVQDLVTNGVVNHGQGKALSAKLEAALQQYDRGNEGASVNQLEAFINQMTALIDAGVISAADAQPLIDIARASIDQLLMGKVDADAPSVTVDAAALPESYDLHQNYPNPFNPSTTLTVRSPAIHLKSPFRQVQAPVASPLISLLPLSYTVDTLCERMPLRCLPLHRHFGCMIGFLHLGRSSLYMGSEHLHFDRLRRGSL